MVAIFCFEIPTYWDLKYSKHFLFNIFLNDPRGTAFQADVGCMLDSEGVAPGYSDTAFQADFLIKYFP